MMRSVSWPAWREQRLYLLMLNGLDMRVVSPKRCLHLQGIVREVELEKRLRYAKAYLEEIRASTKQLEVDGHDDSDVDNEAKQREALSARDSIVANFLQQAQLEESGRVQQKLAIRVIKLDVPALGEHVGKRHRHTITAVDLSEDDSKGFAASRDGLIMHWDVEAGSSDNYIWPKIVS
ncbi:hypothetical protein L7F22_046692 [Adiantum nelumboides]|nr:hypothetical protein [Adiantum nelumboides]